MAPEGITDTTSRSLFTDPNDKTAFNKYIFLYEVMAQLTRLAYCDSGFIKIVLDTKFAEENYIVMKFIDSLEKTNLAKKRSALIDQKASELVPGIPHESYAMGAAPDVNKHKYGTYISTNEALTAFVIDTTVAKGILLEKGPFKPSDVILSFKGTNTFKEAIHDVKSAFMRVDLKNVATSLGFSVPEEDKDSFINGSFTNILIDAWDVLIQAVTEHSGTGEFRLFCTGHSLGGAYCTLFGFILGYLKTLQPTEESPTVKLLNRITSIHVISLGSPTVCADKARNIFNRALTSKFMTFDRLVTQWRATLTAIPAFTDFVPLIPGGFSHPGFKQKIGFSSQDKKRPYKLSSIYHLYGEGEPKVYKIIEPPADEIKKLEEVSKEGETSAKAASATNLAKDAATPNNSGAEPAAAEPAVEDESGDTQTTRVKGNTTKKRTKGGYRKTHRGGGIFNSLKGAVYSRVFGKEKAEYEKLAVTQSSNFISVPARGKFGTLVPHAVYFGMKYLSSLRYPGMKNPVPPKVNKSAYFGFYDDKGGVLINYIDSVSRKITTPIRTSSYVIPGRGTRAMGRNMGVNQGKQVNEYKKKLPPGARNRVNGVWLGGTRRRAEK